MLRHQGEQTVGSIGEFALIDTLSSLAGPARAEVGIGDDAAVLDLGGPELLLATVDMTVEGIHFIPECVSARDVGRRAVASSMSDIAAMGGRPVNVLVSLALRPEQPVAFVEEAYRGIVEECLKYGATIAGGNVTGTGGPWSIDVTVLGQVRRDELLVRRGTRIGDVFAVTGSLGNASTVRLLCRRPELSELVSEAWKRRHAVPVPRIAAGSALASRHLAHAMMDVSDGLSSDLYHLCAASGVGAVIEGESLPISDEVRRVAAAAGEDPADMALNGGEDYELLLALPPECVAGAASAVGTAGFTVIGSAVPPARGVTLRTGTGTRELEPKGWTHLR